MSLLLSCPAGPTPSICAPSKDDVMDSVLGLLPPGPAWEGAQIEGTVQHTYWRAYANVLNHLYSRMCAFVDEFYCKTANESLDQWIEEYGLNAECDPYGHNLCIKVAAEGGSTCEYFVKIAQLSGWSITCEDTRDIPEPIAGCFEVGCTSLGPTPTYAGRGSMLGYGQRGVCEYGEVVHHPDVAKWEAGHTAGSQCTVPGSNLGHGPDAEESCCFIVGYYDFTTPVRPFVPDFCQGISDTIYFDCPRVGIPGDGVITPISPTAGAYDDNGNYSEWGHAFVWKVIVDMAASEAAQAQVAAEVTPNTDPTSQAGCLMAGNITFPNADGEIGGSPLCNNNTVGVVPTFVLCFLNLIKPAHTVLNVEILQS